MFSNEAILAAKAALTKYFAVLVDEKRLDPYAVTETDVDWLVNSLIEHMEEAEIKLDLEQHEADLETREPDADNE